MHFSPDGSQASVVVTDSQEAANVWLFDVARGVRTPLTVSGRVSASIWSPDGRRVVFASNLGICTKRLSTGEGPEELLLASDVRKLPESWSPDGRFLIYGNGRRPRGRLLTVTPISGSCPCSAIASPFDHRVAVFRRREPVFSRRPLAGVQLERVRTIRGVRCAVPGPGGRVRISTAGGDNARWRRDGKEIFFLAGTR